MPDYMRVPTVATAPEFIDGLADLVEADARGRSARHLWTGPHLPGRMGTVRL